MRRAPGGREIHLGASGGGADWIGLPSSGGSTGVAGGSAGAGGGDPVCGDGVCDGSESCDHIKQDPFWNFQPRSGACYGFMVSGLARDAVRNVYERSQVRKIQWR